MKAMILAAGRGERMRPLTDHTPKPLLQVAGKPLIVHTIVQLVNAGFHDLVINHAHLGYQIEQQLGDGSQFGATISYSPEPDGALETAGGIINALPLLGHEPFLVINGDIASDFPFATLKQVQVDLAHLILVDNPDHHPQGDFYLHDNGSIRTEGPHKLTFSGIGLYHPDLFKGVPPGKSKLAPLLRQAMTEHKVNGTKLTGFWMDIGTPERLHALEQYYLQRATTSSLHSPT